ncbi:hook protein [Danaus plexippus plexippus]|uniref:Hook protein n=1 Tax=Danaus plexippus plexippus TaxID=278856 RepID=A0A212FGQ9_DANPL|nr:girdin [Danaus plexippus plexippus]OWR52910.1 hook protein [Danaus plexippus plexippus]
MAASATEIDDFLSGPLVSWLKSCIPNPDTIQEYSSLFNGDILYHIYLQIDPEPSFHITKLTGLEDQALILGRVKNFDAIIKNLKNLYDEELGMTLLVVPECICLGKAPETKQGLENMKLLVLLLLGAAVQCPNKEIFITRIKELDVDLQHNIVQCIKQVTDMQTVVLTPDAIDLFQSPTMFNHMRRLAKERDHYLQNWATLVLNEDLCETENENKNVNRSTQNISQNNGESQHLAVELADWKARLRKQRQELEEKSEQLSECREELEHTKLVLAKLRTESQEWFNEARKATGYRDEVDALREKAERCDRLEQEIQRYRDRLADAEYYKTRVTELREDNKALMDTRDALEEQLQRARKRAEQCLSLEAAMIKLKREANDIALERDADQQKIQELIEENNHLQYITRSVLSESNNSNLDTDNECENTLESGENSLSEQLTSNAQARALKLELENKRLLSTIDSLREQSLLEGSDKVLDLEKEKKRLALKCEQLQENCNRFKQQNSELEEVFKNALEENRKLQDSIDSQKAFIDRQSIDRDSEKNKLQDFENHLESLTKDKQRMQMLCESIQRRADDLERTLDARTKELNNIKPEAEKATLLIIQTEELKTKLTYSEKESHSLQREVNKLREAVEEKDVIIDRISTEIEIKNKEIERLARQIEINQNLSSRLQDLEQKTQELKSHKKVDTETIQMLQKDLISEKVNFDKLRNCMEKIGINTSDVISKDVSVEDLLDRIITNVDHEALISEITSKTICSKSVPCNCHNSEKPEVDENVINPQIEQLNADLAALQVSLENCQAENAKLQVNIATLNSQNGSLISQQMTLQLANSQLAAEKDEIMKQLEVLKDKQDDLLRDQVALQTLHEQLNMEYEMLLSEKEPVKAAIRDLKIENRELKEKLTGYEKKIADFELERENLKIESRNLTNLRAEHSKLKEDFRNLFTASDRLKNEYRNMQDEYRNLRSEVSQLKLRNTEMSGEINTKVEVITSMELEISKTNQHCEMLILMNKNLDADRRSLMDHVSQLLTQYHELLAHSLKDKQHYHEEEKMFADRVNALCRQKEKLEEKIMEHYKKLDNCTTKRRGFGASFVKRVRKAGTDLINKVPSRNKRIEDANRSKSQLTLAGSESGESDPGQDVEKLSKHSDYDQGSSNLNMESPRHSVDSSFNRRLEDIFKKSDNIDMSGSIHSLDPIRLNEGNFVRRLSAASIHSGGGDDALIRASLRRRPHKAVPPTHRNSFQGLEPDPSLPAASNPSPVFGTAGTRRTVYLAEDNPEVNLNSKPQSTPIKENPTYLVYNRISTVIGDGASQSNSDRLNDRSVPEQSRNTEENPVEREASRDKSVNRKDVNESSKETAIWYEYGCV